MSVVTVGELGGIHPGHKHSAHQQALCAEAWFYRTGLAFSVQHVMRMPQLRVRLICIQDF